MQLPGMEYKKDAVISPCQKYRFCLTRIWDKSKPLLLFIGLNPSTADGKEDDPTIRRMIGFTKSNDCGGFYLLNLFAWRATEPAELKKTLNPVGELNDVWLFRVTDMARFDKVVFCWGAFDELDGRDKKVIGMFPGAYCLGKTKAGHPKHPLYLPAATRLELF